MILKQKMDRIVKLLHWYNNFMGYSNSYSMPPYAHYISMGNFCLPRSFLTEWGIKPRKASGELSMPFDLMHIDPIALNYFLLFNFFGFFKNIRLDEKTSIFRRDGEFYSLFNHDADLGTDFSKLKERYQKRIANLKNILKSKDNLLFIQACENSYSDINTLYEILCFLRKNRPFRLILLDLTPDKPLDVSQINKNITVIREPYPTHEWLWYDHELRKTEKGIEFENRLRSKIVSVITIK